MLPTHAHQPTSTHAVAHARRREPQQLVDDPVQIDEQRRRDSIGRLCPPVIHTSIHTRRSRARTSASHVTRANSRLVPPSLLRSSLAECIAALVRARVLARAIVVATRGSRRATAASRMAKACGSVGTVAVTCSTHVTTTTSHVRASYQAAARASPTRAARRQ
jgi:hypothetical protein